MSILVVGSVALDSVRTPFKEAKDVLGGSASYFAYAASYFGEVSLVAAVGGDFPQKYVNLFAKKGIDVTGLKKNDGKTFRWSGVYREDINQRETLSVNLGVLEDFCPELSDRHKKSEYIFLANIDPELQLHILNQIENPKLVVCDTMDIWIENKKSELLEVFKRADVVLLNDSEARQLAKESNFVKAADKILKLGARYVVIKKGKHGVMLFTEDACFSLPAYPVRDVLDPTGAGDSFGGGFLGYVSKKNDTSCNAIRNALVYGTIMASFTVEDFSLNRLITLKEHEIEKRIKEFRKILETENLTQSFGCV
ncbi:bifunctional hydroxymethylpyrimidine kinase/phosphomethylpyrimidine kinase [bacterium]|nr:bifunctional hydroxymethylpyrimidine kinase/phosphomethylpyrimidine kinase [bacterium]